VSDSDFLLLWLVALNASLGMFFYYANAWLKGGRR